MSLPFFSIIIPTYCRPLQLDNCLKALARLDYPGERFEVIVVDDGSNSPPNDVVASWANQLDVKLIVRPHAGPAAARNSGAVYGRGEILAFTDDDCWPDPGWLNAFANRFAIAPANLIGGTINAFPNNLYSAASQSIIDVVYRHFNTNDRVLFFASNNFAVPTEAFRRLGGFNEQFQTSEDREFCDRWIQRGYRMTYAGDAVIHHAHPLQLRSLWRQHFGYGRGAFRFHRGRWAQQRLPINPDSRFYLKLLSHPYSVERGHRRLMLTTLVCWSQLASTAGFTWELLRQIRAKD